MMRIVQQETAIDAYHAHCVSGKSAAQRNRILEFIESRGGDWSIGEIARALNLEKSTVSARIYELLHETQELAERAKRKDRVSGILIRPVGLPVMQSELFS